MKRPVALRFALSLLVIASTFSSMAGGPSDPRDAPSRASERSEDVRAGWALVWSDEFDEPGAPDPRYWSHEVNCWGGGNNERQCYTDRSDNAYVDAGGYLHIVAKEEFYAGPSLQDDDPDYPGPLVHRNYTSARLRTKNKVDWTYGRIEVRAKVPGGRGMWPAIWMLPTDWVYGGWPSSGEIDVMEAVNLARGRYPGWGDVVHGTAHYGLPWPQWENHGASYRLDANPADDFHTYALEWERDELRWYVDGVHWQTQRSEGWYNYVWRGQDEGFVVASATAPFDRRFHLIMNVAVGGDWPGPPDRRWDSDREMIVDYVRLYQCARGSVEGRGRACGTIDPEVEVNEDHGGPGVNDYVAYDGGAEALPVEVGPSSAPTVVELPLERGAFAFPGVEVRSEPKANGAWEIELRQSGLLTWGAFVGNVFLGAADAGVTLYGGSGWSTNGELRFDLKVKRIDPETRLFVKMDSGYPAVGSVEIDVPPKGAWHSVAVRVSDLLADRGPGESPLDLRDVRNVFVLESTGPAHVWVDRIRLRCAYNTEPEWWQPDKTCGLRLSPSRHRAGESVDGGATRPTSGSGPTTRPPYGGRAELEPR